MKENTKGIVTLVLTALGYIYYVFPTMHELFNTATIPAATITVPTRDSMSRVKNIISFCQKVIGLNNSCMVGNT